MKLGPLEGTTEEIKDMIVASGGTLEQYLQKPKSELKNIFFFIPAGANLIALLSLWFTHSYHQEYVAFVLVIELAAIGWMATVVAIAFDRVLPAVVIAVSLLLAALVAAGLLDPMRIPQILKPFAKD
ncbi:MAG: hypothetical protein V4607_15100 [Pseudomonadota bacterium]